MGISPTPARELERQESLLRYGLATDADVVSDPDLELVAAMAVQITGAAGAGVNIIDADRQISLASIGVAPAELPRSQSLCSLAMWEPAADGIFATGDAGAEPLFAGNPWVTGELAAVKTYVAAPLTGREGLPLGTLCVYDLEELPPLSSTQRESLARLAGFVVRILELRRRASEMEQDALHDALTGLPNRRLLRDRLDLALARRTRVSGEPILILIDLDHFKSVNDNHGHAAGDAALVAVADRLRLAVRMEDTVARLGGDEFVVLCERVRAEHSDLLIGRVAEGLNQPLRLPSGAVLDLTATIGVAFAGEGETAATLLARADDAMYARRRARRG